MCPGEGGSSEKATYCMIPTRRHSGKGKTMEAGKRSVAAGGWEGGVKRQSTRILRAATRFRVTSDDGCLTSLVCLNPLNAQTPRRNPDANYGPCVSEGSSTGQARRSGGCGGRARLRGWGRGHRGHLWTFSQWCRAQNCSKSLLEKQQH